MGKRGDLLMDLNAYPNVALLQEKIFNTLQTNIFLQKDRKMCIILQLHDYKY